ncbi:methylsterol monooxygenase 1-1 [Prunus yedoensis var. nudiflora]|uniref:Methylsterol monooxygenase 1-1 n=1 Tax=Prunus yedoensis var. nudiflora TaxID=2094558 RepID=A0A314UQR8_PRUYE|nr:methylsterol monooxygenase 1-1 [Prunus yedoensis var. nudiflora]
MLPYQSLEEAEEALGRALSVAEKLWFQYSAQKPDLILHCHNILFVMLFYTLAPLPFVFIGLGWFKNMDKFKIQPKVKDSFSNMFKCYKHVMRTFVLVVGPLQVISYPTIQWIGIRTSLPLPSSSEIHRVHHEYTAPIGLAAPYAHWAEILILGLPSFLGPVLVPEHIITYWLWFILRQLEAIETHSGYLLPWTPTKYIPFYGGAEYHDYHHFVGEQSKSNFASIFTYCDYIYGTQ